jgi:two-component system sensor kinase FixL
MIAPDRQTVSILALCVAVAVVVFVADLYLPLGVAGGVPYIGLVLLGLWLPWLGATLALAAIATVLIIADLFLSVPHGELWIVLTNRGLALAASWITGILGFLQKRAVRRLRDDEARLRVVTDTAIDGIVVIDSGGIIEMANPACERMFGYSLQELVGRNVSMLMPSPDREQHDGYLRRYLETGEKRIIGIGREVLARRKDGTIFPIQLAVGEASVSGKRMFTGFVHDVSERKQAQQKVQELQSDLYRVSRLGELGEMAAVIAHELNQPLTAVSSYIEAARQGLRRSGTAVPEAANELMSKAMSQAQRASEVIRHIRAMAGREPTDRAFEDVNAVVEEATGLALLGAEAKGVSASMKLADKLPPGLINRTQIQQVVLNLVRNGVDAVDGSNARQLVIGTAPAGDGHIEVSVADSGPGLPEEVRANLFKPFVTTKAGGMGIGLSVSRSIVEAHGGRLWVETGECGGAVFRFTLPAAVMDGADDGE